MMVDCYGRHPVAAVLENGTAAQSEEIMGHRRDEMRQFARHIRHCKWLVRTTCLHFNWIFILALLRGHCHSPLI